MDKAHALVAAPPAVRRPGLDVLRTFAIVWVMFYHAQIMGLGTPLPAFTRWGWMGVDLFFVLSGFLIGGQLFAPMRCGQRPNITEFMGKRAFRILPAYALMVLLYFAMPDWRETAKIQPLWQFLTFTENLLIDFSSPKAFSHVWSLCVEEHFYLLLPMICLVLFGRVGPKRVMAVLVAVLVGGMLLRGALWLYELEPLLATPANADLFGQRYMELIYYPTWSRLDGLLAGVALALVREFRPQVWNRVQQHGTALLVGASLLLAGAFWLLQDREAFWPVVLGFPLLAAGLAFLVAAADSEHSVLARLCLPGVTTIAAMAFSLYLSHKMVWAVARTHWGAYLHDQGGLAFVVYAVVGLMGGLVLYGLLERPSLQWRARWLAYRRESSRMATQSAVV
ncbi:acyltransferase family protein [Chitinimonas sp. PSY-7]|uniref:acyltransferase family protein n=1 Tax=Chitinimonas sp. PSY-7 TaxID=3459088 RepID=UPI00403FE270